MADQSGTAGIQLPTWYFIVDGETGTSDVSFPRLAADAEGLFGDAGMGNSSLSITISSQGKTGVVGSSSISLSRLNVSGDNLGGGELDVSLHRPMLSGVGKSGELGSFSKSLPKLTIVSSGVRQGDNVGNVILPLLSMVSSGVHGGQSSFDNSIKLFTIDGSGISGQVGSADLTLQFNSVSASGFLNVIGSSSFNLFPLVLEAFGVTDIASTLSDDIVSLSTIVMNLQNHGVSTYSNYLFNSYCEFNGYYLGATSDGIYLLLGTQDITTSINTIMRKEAIGQQIFEKKTLPVVFADLNTDGEYDLTIQSEDTQMSYEGVPYNPNMRIQKIKGGRGIKGRYFAVEIKNRDGGNMKINSIELPFEISETRKGR